MPTESPDKPSVPSELDVSVIIVSYNVRELLARCLLSLKSGATESTCDVIVVDNASSDGSAEYVRKEFPDVQVIESQINHGYGGALNQAARQACGRYLLLLNPDTEIGESAIDRLVQSLDASPTVAVVGPRLRYPDGSIQASRRRFPTLVTALVESTVAQRWWPTSPILERYYRQDLPDAPQDVDWLVGACLLIRRSVFEIVGGFDERFFMYSEELDFCRRVREAGLLVRYEPTAEVIHHEGRSSEQNLAKRAFQFNESKCRYFEKYYGPGVGLALRVALLSSTGYDLLQETAKLALGHRPELRRQRVRSLSMVLLDQVSRLIGQVMSPSRTSTNDSVVRPLFSLTDNPKEKNKT